jgi:hypothetical protein
MTDLPTFLPSADTESLTTTGPKSLCGKQCALRDSNTEPSDPKSVGQDDSSRTAYDNGGQKATEPDQSSPLSYPPSYHAAPGTDEARIEAFLVKKWCYRVYRKALRSGRLVPGPCFADGPDCRGKKGNGHHHDYRYPHDVVWCCAGHHNALDRLRRDGRTLASAMVAVLVLQGRTDAAA